MKRINLMAVFCEDKSTLAYLKGYCFAINIDMTVASFNAHGINEITKQKPDLIVVQYDWVNVHRRLEPNLLRQLAELNQVKILCLNTNSNQTIPSKLPEWTNEIVTNQFGISEYVKKTFLLNTRLSENKRYRERRSFTDRRNIKFNNHNDDGYRVPKNQDYQHEAGDPGVIDFKIDQRNKCLLINEDKIYLTPKEFELLELMLSDDSRVFMNDEIIKCLWPENHRVAKSDLYQYMYLLRRKIEKGSKNRQVIITVRGFGYRLNEVYINKINNEALG
jgi:DNA-binding response OmpR family regulator